MPSGKDRQGRIDFPFLRIRFWDFLFFFFLFKFNFPFLSVEKHGGFLCFSVTFLRHHSRRRPREKVVTPVTSWNPARYTYPDAAAAFFKHSVQG
jgi:hypothetical protein